MQRIWFVYFRVYTVVVYIFKLFSFVNDLEYPFEAPYVVLFHNHCRIDEEKLLFEFNHPNPSAKIDNNRYGSIDFTAKFDATLHGMGGYFDSHLYKDIDISKH